jgi:hypothetical protein
MRIGPVFSQFVILIFFDLDWIPKKLFLLPLICSVGTNAQNQKKKVDHQKYCMDALLQSIAVEWKMVLAFWNWQ